MTTPAAGSATAMLELLTTEEMARADRLAIESGTPGLTLMENAGRAVADEVSRRFPDADRVAVLCGPGNNGGDGFVAARHLKGRGLRPRVALLGEAARLRGDAARMAQAWDGGIEPLGVGILEGAAVVVDALFGAGLARPVGGRAAEIVRAINAGGFPVIAVDVPSGIDGTTGEVRGVAVEALATVTFCRRKPGHLLLPGRLHCGETVLADIGIPDAAVATVGARTFANAPALWLDDFPWPQLGGHKYSRGHAVVVSGPPDATGAARLGARGALRIGAGLVTVACPPDALAVNAAQLTAIMVRAADGAAGLARLLEDERKNAILIGPGAGVGKGTREAVGTVLRGKAAAVLDADALTSFADDGESLFGMIGRRSQPTVLTPHEGEFSRLFGDAAANGSKLDRARRGSARSGAIVLLKGSDTVLAQPDGYAVINENAPPWLATAGAGDVLGGFVAGLLAQHMPPLQAACAAVWLHGAAASAFGPGLIAEDLPEMLPHVLRELAAGA